MKKILLKKVSIFLLLTFFLNLQILGMAVANSNVSWDTQEDFMRGVLDDNIDLNQSPGDVKLKQNVNNLTQTTLNDFDNGNNNSGVEIESVNGGEISLSEFYSYNEEGDAHCHGYSYAMTPIYDEDSGLFYCGSFGSSADGLSVIDTKKTDNFLDDETLFVYSTTSDPAIASNNIWQTYLNKNLNLMYVGTDNGLSVIDTKGTNDPSDDELLNTYNASSSPAIASNVVRYLDFDESTGLLYVSAYNGGLSVVNTQNTATPSDDTLVVTYSTTSTPAIVGNRASFSLLDKTNNYLYVGTWNSGISVIDTKGTISAADDTLVRTYTTATTPHLNYAYIERIYLDKDENLLYVVAQSGAPGALNVVDLDNNTSFAYKVDGVYDTTDSSTGTIISSEPVLRSNSVSDVFVDKNTGYMYVSHYNVPDAMTVMDTKKTYEDPSDDVVYKVYGDSTNPRIPNYSYDNAGWRIGRNVQGDMLFLTSGTVGHGGVYFIPLEERESYQGQYYSDYLKYSDVPSDSVSWQGNIENGQTSVQIRSTEDDGIVEMISDFDDNDTSEYLGDYYSWGGTFQDAVENEGTMKLSNPSPNVCSGGVCEWVDFWFDTGKPDNYYPAGTIIKARIRANSDREFGYYADYMIGDQWSSSSESFFGNEWKVVEFTASSSFSKIGFDFNWRTGTWDDVNDSFEIDWIKAYSGSVNWGEWSDVCDNNFGCEIPKSENDKYFQYRLNMSGNLENFDISDVTLSSDYQSSGTYTSDNAILSGKNKELITLYIDKTTPAGTDINLEYSLDDGANWVNIGNVDEYNFPEKTRSTQFKWRAILTTSDLNETPILHSVSFEPIDVNLDDPDISDIKIKIGKNKSKDLDKEKTFYSKEKKPKFKGTNTETPGGIIKVYERNKKGGKKLIEEIDVDEDGNWSEKIKLDEGTNYLYFRAVDSTGNESDLTGKIKVKVDTEDPVFTEFPASVTVAKGQQINFLANDEGTGIDYYRVQLVGQRSPRSQEESYYIIPEDVPYGEYVLDIRAYDKARNKETISININYVASQSQSQSQISQAQSPEVQGVYDQQNIQEVGNADIIDASDDQIREEIYPENTFNPITPQTEEKNKKSWWNPFSWF